MIDPHAFAAEWVAAWNSHDLDRILSHYADDVEVTSPFVERVMGQGQGALRGKAAVRAYWRRALDAYPDLRFTLFGAYPGVGSVVLHYQGVAGLDGAEFMRFDASGRVREVVAHYAPHQPPTPMDQADGAAR